MALTKDEKRIADSLRAAERAAYIAMRDAGVDHAHAFRLAVECPSDTQRVARKNQGWVSGVEAARRAVKHDDSSGFVLGTVGTPEYRRAFRLGVQAYYRGKDMGMW